MRAALAADGLPADPDGTGARNLFGFSDGTANLDRRDDAALAEHVWVGGADEPRWLHGGSYLVVRRIRMRLEQWDASSLREQEAAIGRARSDGHRLPGRQRSHAALARPEANGGTRILRRGYAFAAGLDERGRLDAGLLFLAWQRDPHAQFVPIQHRLAQHDEMNEYVEHVGSALFVAPPGIQPGGWWGQPLLAER